MNTTEGRILPLLANAIAAFRHAPEWGGVLGFNEFEFGTVVLKPVPWGIVPKESRPVRKTVWRQNGFRNSGFLFPLKSPGCADYGPRSSVPPSEDLFEGASI